GFHVGIGREVGGRIEHAGAVDKPGQRFPLACGRDGGLPALPAGGPVATQVQFAIGSSSPGGAVRQEMVDGLALPAPDPQADGGDVPVPVESSRPAQVLGHGLGLPVGAVHGASPGYSRLTRSTTRAALYWSTWSKK